MIQRKTLKTVRDAYPTRLFKRLTTEDTVVFSMVNNPYQPDLDNTFTVSYRA